MTSNNIFKDITTCESERTLCTSHAHGSNDFFRLIRISNSRLELWSHRISVSKTFEKMSHRLRSCFILTCVCDLLPCTTGEFHLPMDEVDDNESHCSKSLRLTFYLICLVSGTLAKRNFWFAEFIGDYCRPVNISKAMFADT